MIGNAQSLVCGTRVVEQASMVTAIEGTGLLAWGLSEQLRVMEDLVLDEEPSRGRHKTVSGSTSGPQLSRM